MKKKFLFLFICFLLVPFLPYSHAARDDSGDGIVTYPDGRLGMDIGGGYQTTPDGENLMAEAYRAPLANSYYGPMTPKGYELFPKFEFPDSKEKDAKAKEDRARYQEMFMAPTTEATTTTAPPERRTLLYGVSSPIESE